ncbi:TPA: hypothetical protein ACSBZO_003741 [Acinetobacter baumannii]
MKAKKLLEKLGAKGIKKILESAHQEAVYFVDEWNEHFKVHGFYTDKCIVGVHNPHSHYKLSELKQALGGEHGYKRDLNKYSDELSRYQNLSRTGLSREEMLVIDRIIIRLKNKINNLRSMLNA